MDMQVAVVLAQQMDLLGSVTSVPRWMFDPRRPHLIGYVFGVCAYRAVDTDGVLKYWAVDDFGAPFELRDEHMMVAAIMWQNWRFGIAYLELCE